MENNISVKLSSVYKEYELFTKRPIFLKNIFRQNKKYFTSLIDISFSVLKGESIGLIGENGSGKSTILKLIAGVTVASKGKINTAGRIGSLIELGAGFIYDMTGYENIFLNGALMGYSKDDLETKVKTIIDFSELKKYIHDPIRTYSSGMLMRLGFSIAINSNPDILLIDEVLAVGDGKFQSKCIKEISRLKKRGTTIIFVSHNLNLIQTICNKCIWLKNGKIREIGETSKVISKYSNYLTNESNSNIKSVKRWGTKKMLITSCKIINSKNIKTKSLKVNEPFSITYKCITNNTVINPIYGITISDESGKDVFYTNTIIKNMKTKKYIKGDISQVTIKFNDSLPVGKYFVSPAIASNNTREFYDWVSNYVSFTVGSKKSTGTLAPTHSIKIT